MCCGFSLAADRRVAARGQREALMTNELEDIHATIDAFGYLILNLYIDRFGQTENPIETFVAFAKKIEHDMETPDVITRMPVDEEQARTVKRQMRPMLHLFLQNLHDSLAMRFPG